MNTKPREEQNPYLGEEVYTKMRNENANPLPTLGELVKEAREEGRKEGKKKPGRK